MDGLLDGAACAGDPPLLGNQGGAFVVLGGDASAAQKTDRLVGQILSDRLQTFPECFELMHR